MTEDSPDLLRIDIADGKYTVVQPRSAQTYILRHGEPWLGEGNSGFPGTGCVLSMAYELEELRAAQPASSLKADLVHQAKLLERVAGLKLVQEGLEDEGDRVYFGSTNDADQFREVLQAVYEDDFERAVFPAKERDLYAEMRTMSAELEEMRAKVQERVTGKPGINISLNDAISMIDALKGGHVDTVISVINGIIEGRRDEVIQSLQGPSRIYPGLEKGEFPSERDPIQDALDHIATGSGPKWTGERDDGPERTAPDETHGDCS